MESLEEFDEVVHEPDEAFVESTNVYAFMQEYGIDNYADLIERTRDVEWFWDELPDYLGIEWYEAYDAVRDDSDGPQFTHWYPGGTLNVAHNTVDRHAARDAERRNKVACIWEGEDGEVRNLTYHELKRQSNQVANYLESVGVETGDTVALYMPMVPEVIAILYGCFKAGAIAVPIFSGFGVEATATRLEDPEVDVLFTADGFYRRGRQVTLMDNADEAIAITGSSSGNMLSSNVTD
jgi:acetyl-CoA synthetase